MKCPKWVFPEIGTGTSITEHLYQSPGEGSLQWNLFKCANDIMLFQVVKFIDNDTKFQKEFTKLNGWKPTR